jgi:16S rRNA (guanine527-N7)-methyltransferase
MEPSNTIPPAPVNNVTDETWNSWKNYLREQFAISLDDAALTKFKILLAELQEWNNKFNLVSFRSADEILWRHFADSLAAVPLIRKHGGTEIPRIADIGTGAGFPGIPVKIVLPASPLTLVESVTKKCTFIEHIAQMLQLPQVRVLNERVENIAQNREHREQYDVVLSRAVAKFSPNLEISLPLAKPQGTVLIYKTEQSAYGPEGLPSVEHALSLLKGRLADAIKYRIPGQEHGYVILAFAKSGPMPPQYPRRVGVPEKKPL